MKTLDKSLDILEQFFKGDEELTISQLASTTDINKATVNKIVKKFVERGYLKQRGRRGKYAASPIYVEYSGIIKRRTKLRDVAVPHLMELSRITDEAVLIAYRDWSDSIYTEMFHHHNHPSRYLLTVMPTEGTGLSLHASSAGKLFLAYMTDDELEKYLQNRVLQKLTEKTITDPQVLKQELLAIRASGISLDVDEYTVGVSGIASAIRNDENRVVGAISLLIPNIRMPRRKKQRQALEQRVLQCALDISGELGFKDIINQAY